MSNALRRRLDAIKEHGGIKGSDIAQLMDTTPETVSRWSRGKVDPRPDRLKRLLTLEWVMDQLAELYEPDEARLWLFAPHRLLNGETPADRGLDGRRTSTKITIIQRVTGNSRNYGNRY